MGEEVFVLFVKPSGDEENSSLLTKAFETLTTSSYNFKHEWIPVEDCLGVKSKGKQIYVFDPFESEAFQHLKNLGCRIYGPQCILTCLTRSVELPLRRSPVYNLAMKGVKICYTSIDKTARDDISKKIHMMAGEIDNNLTLDVTHLIAGEVGSNKYMVALDNGKSVMVKEWVNTVWEASQHSLRHVSATDDIFDKYKCPVFLGLTIVVSGYANRERTQLKNFVNRGGGKYSGELKMNECTHLIIKEPKGAKYEAARQWKIRIIKDKWLYDCMDKGRYVDPQPYQFNSLPREKNKTSTPERSSAIGPQISDISAITATGSNPFQAVDETTNLTRTHSYNLSHTNVEVSETGMLTTFGEDINSIAEPAEVFLDDCKIYLSGISPTTEERFRKLIVAAGGLRSIDLKGDVTHVVIGEVNPSDVLVFRKMVECPYVVRCEWLTDCFKQNSHVAETEYLRTDMGLKLPTRRQKDVHNKFNKESSSPAAYPITITAASADKVQNESCEQAKESSVMDKETPSDLEMADLLSQYMMQDQGDVGEVDAQAHHANRSKEVQPQPEEVEEVMTQDPDVEGKTLFSGTSFVILGFNDDEAAELGLFIQNKGGEVLPYGQKQKVVDIAVVPLMGFPVDVTVTEVLTNAWLQMCIESDTLIPYDKHWLARPIDLPQDEPLSQCCLCVSGYVGVERDSIIHLGQALGAICQDNFARRATKDVQASTHLIVNQTSGSKYGAAKRWKIPAVGIEWLLACIKARECVPPGNYHIDVLEEEKSMQADKTIVRSDLTGDKVMSASSRSSKPSVSRSDSTEVMKQKDSNIGTGGGHQDSSDSRDGQTLPGQSKLRQEEEARNTEKEEEARNTEKAEKARNTEKEEKARNTEKEEEERNTEKEEKARNTEKEFETPAPVPSSSSESTTPSSNKTAPSTSTPVNPMAKVMSRLTSTPLNKHDNQGLREDDAEKSLRKSACRPNQSENITAGALRTPVDRIRQKWGQSNENDTPGSGTPLGLVKGGGETPGTFLKPGFKPKFNLNLDALFPSPEPDQLNKSTPVGEVFARVIRRAAQRAATLKPEDSQQEDMPASQTAALHCVVIAVAKKLGCNHNQYNTIVVELGGDYSWHTGQHVTHFVFQGQPNDQNKEFKKAKMDGKIIVSPHWLHACKEQNCRVDETLFPHTYKPNNKLTMTTSARSTPSRSTRATTKGITTTLGAADIRDRKTPKKKVPVMNLPDMLRNETNVEEGLSRIEIREKSSSLSDCKDSSYEQSHTGSVSKVGGDTRPSTQSEQSVVEITGDQPDQMDNECNDNTNETTDKCRNQDKKEALTQTLGNVLAGPSRSKRTAKRKGKIFNLSGQLGSSGEDLSDVGLNKSSSAWAIKETKEAEAVQDTPQCMQVTWDDPTGRLEEKKLAHRLARVCDPSQNTDELLAAMNMPGTAAQASHTTTETKSVSNELRAARSPTPEPPSITFPVVRPVQSILSPQPVELLSEDSSDSHHGHNNRQIPVFLVSGMNNEERVDYSALIEQLGGKVLEKQQFDPSCTHLVAGQPIRNEKYLSCVASGKWVLHKSYLEACRKEGKFVLEETHEWGSEFTLPLMQNMTAQANKLTAAAYKWRKKTFDMKKKKLSGHGAFDGWKVLLCLDKAKQDCFQRLLEAGGAVVSAVRSPLPDCVIGTHAFLDLAKVKVSQDDLEKLIHAEIHCLKAEYIPAFLTDDPPPDPSQFYPAEVIALKARLHEPSSRKRKCVSGSDKELSTGRKSSRH